MRSYPRLWIRRDLTLLNRALLSAPYVSSTRHDRSVIRGSPEQVINGWRYFGHHPVGAENDAGMGRRHAEKFLELMGGNGFAQPNSLDETGEPFHIQQATQIRAFGAAWNEAGHARAPHISVSRSIFALIDDRDRAYFGRGRPEAHKIGFLDKTTPAIFGRGYADEPDVLIEQLRKDAAVAAADTLLLTVPNQLAVAYNAHVVEAILTTVALPSVGAKSPVPRN
jgi:hypothetical protein